MTGWALFLDYLIVIALSALFLPHYLAGALQVNALDRKPWDVDRRRSCVIAVVALVRLVRRPSLYGLGIVVPALDLLTQLLLVVLGLRARLLAARAHARHVARLEPDVARPRVRAPARDARVHRARDGREPRRGGAAARASTCRARCSAAIATVVTVYVAIAVVALSAFPGPKTELGTTWIRAPLLGVADRHRPQAAVGSRRRAPLLRRHHRRADPARRGDDVGLRLLAARVLARRARPAAARVRAAEPPRARLAVRDLLGRASSRRRS